MPLRLSDTIMAPSRITAADAYAVAQRVNAYDLPFLREMFDEYERLCRRYGFALEYVVGQSAHETGRWSPRNPNWTKLHNPAGLAITNSANKSLTYTRGVDAARAHLVHLYVYCMGPVPAESELAEYIGLDGHYWEAVTGVNRQSGRPFAGSVRTVADFNVNGTWALLDRTNTPTGPLNDYGNRILRETRALFGDLPDQVTDDPPVTTPSTPEEPVEKLTFHRVPNYGYIDRQAQTAAKPEGVGWDNLGRRIPRFIALHRMWGTLWGTDGWFNNRTVGALTDFGIGVAATDGASNAGTILQWNDPTGYRSGWASGRVSAPYGDGKKIVDKYGVNAVNRDGVSVEISGYETTAIDPTAWQELVHLCAWWVDYMEIPYHTRVNPKTGINYLIWHQEFTIGTGKLCPWQVVMSLTDRLYDDIAKFLKPFQTGVAGQPVPIPEPVPVPKPTYAPPKPIPELVPISDFDADRAAAVVTAEGRDFVFVNDRVRAVRNTRRRQTAEQDALDIGPIIPKGTEFDVTWLTKTAKGELYYITPWWSRVLVADTERVKDAP